MLAIAAVCFLVGFLGAVTGVGGVLIPVVLMFAGGQETHVAMGTALASFFPLSLFSAFIYARMGWYTPGKALIFLLGGIVGGIVGGRLNAYVPGPPLVCLLACIIIFAGGAALRPRRQGRGSAFWLSSRGLFSMGVVTGLTAGLTGAGGPVLSIPWMVAVGYTPFYAVGSSMFMQLGTILSAAMMLRYSFDMAKEADVIEEAVNAVLDQGYRTGDILQEGCKRVSCSEMGDLVAAQIG